MLAMECSTTAKEQMVVSRLKLFMEHALLAEGPLPAADAMAQVLVLFAKVRVGL